MKYAFICCLASILIPTGNIRAQKATASEDVGKSPQTKAESTKFLETSTNEDVLKFVTSLTQKHKNLFKGVLAETDDGHEIVYLIASRPGISTAQEIKKSGRPIVYITANIHAGEVEGKEASLALIRDLLDESRPNVLDSIVLVVVPNYNASGNISLAPQARNRGEQRGPELVGTRSNGRRINLNRDYTKASEAETRGFLKLFNELLPDVYLDLHATNGSYHGYSLTYATGLHPNTDPYTRDVILPDLKKRVKDRHGISTFDYGNFGEYEGIVKLTDTVKSTWSSFSAMPRFGTNYVGLRGRIAILTEAYSHDTFEDRIASTRAYVREVLSYVAENAKTIKELSAKNDSSPQVGEQLSLKSRLTRSPYLGEVIAEDIGVLPDRTKISEVGVPTGLYRTGRFRTVKIPVHDRFESSLDITIPDGYLLQPGDSLIIKSLELHGIKSKRLLRDTALTVEKFTVDSYGALPGVVEGARTRSVKGSWSRDTITAVAGAWIVHSNQREGRMAAYLLEPESEDGFLYWNVFGDLVRMGAVYPVIRVLTP